SRFHLFDSGRDLRKMVALRCRALEACEFHICAAEWNFHFDAPLQLGLGFLQATIERELRRAEKPELHSINSRRMCAVVALQRLRVLFQCLVRAREMQK